MDKGNSAQSTIRSLVCVKPECSPGPIVTKVIRSDFLTMSNQRSFQEVPGGPIPGGHQSERPAVSSAR